MCRSDLENVDSEIGHYMVCTSPGIPVQKTLGIL